MHRALQGSSSANANASAHIAKDLPPPQAAESLENRLNSFQNNGAGFTPELTEFFPIFAGNPPADHPYPDAWDFKQDRYPLPAQMPGQVQVDYSEPAPHKINGACLTDDATYTIKGVSKDGAGDLIFLVHKQYKPFLINNTDGNPQANNMGPQDSSSGEDILLSYEQARRDCSETVCDYFRERVFMAAR